MAGHPDEIQNSRPLRTAEKIARLEAQMLAFHQLMDERQKANIDALRVAREQLALRLESMNEFRQQITDERGSYVTRNELDLRLVPLAEAIKGLEGARNFARGRDWTIVWIAGLIAAAIGLVLRFV
jgi:hypothetical protein